MISGSTVAKVEAQLRSAFDKCGDFNMRKIISNGKAVYLANLGNLSGRDYISDCIVKPLTTTNAEIYDDESFLGILCTSEAKTLASVEDTVKSLLGGYAAAFTQIEGGVTIYACMARNDPGRSVSEPENETVVRGPREGFTEKIGDSVALVRKRLKTTKLKIIPLQVGEYSDTTANVLYIDGVADMRVVRTVIDRIKNMTLPAVMDSGYVEQFLTGGRAKLFTEVGNSEKPDKVAAKLVGGRVAIIFDGSPVVLTVPYLFVESLQSAEDYLKTPYYATFIRIIRFMALMISLYLPSFYIAVMEHHKNAVPYKLFEAMTRARSEIPFSLFGELAVILIIFEFIREVGVRMPGSVGSAVSIVGGLIIGDAAISAGISSSPVIVVASLTAICTYIEPPFMNSSVLVRFLNIVLARFFGVVGIAVSFVGMTAVLCTKESFGVEYLSPFSTGSDGKSRDGLIMKPGECIKNTVTELEK